MSSSDNDPTQPRIFVLHENTPWVEPLRREFAAVDAPFSEWFLDRGLVDLTSAPPEGIFYNRMSASSHTRGTSLRARVRQAARRAVRQSRPGILVPVAP